MLSARTKVEAPSLPGVSSPLLTWEQIRTALSHPLALPGTVYVHLMRHGETETNAQGVVTGSRDVLLTPRGEEQARQIGTFLDPHYGLAFHSTLSRSRFTLALALKAGRVQVDQIREDSRLNERSLGELEMQPWRSVDEYAQGNLYYAPTGGDTYAVVARRCLSFLLDLAANVAALRPEKILVCSHMGPMRILLGILKEQADSAQVLARSFENTEVVRVPWQRLVLPEFIGNFT